MLAIHDLSARMLHLVPPELAHSIALVSLKARLGPRTDAAKFPSLRTTLAGLELPNPIGLAAGFDKDAVVVDALLKIGFGWVECGTVTPRPQLGSKRPRLYRLDEDQSIINRMGFNNTGMEAVAGRLAKRFGSPGIVGVNIGANKDTSIQAADYVIAMPVLWPWSSYLVINISSPNTPRLRDLQGRDALQDLLGQFDELRIALTDRHGYRPIFLKVAPDLDARNIQDIAEAALKFSLDGLIVSNSTTERPNNLYSRHRNQSGGLTGRALFDSSTILLRDFAEILDGRIPLIGSGGIDSASTAFAKIKAGATALQLYTAMIYQGPGLIQNILVDLDQILRAEGFNILSDAIGADL